MILMVSGRSDVCAYYATWFQRRLEAGFVDVRNPFYPTQVSRIYFADVKAIVFCTKNPIPILPVLDTLQIPYLMQVSVTPYGNDIEVNVHNKKAIIQAVKQISEKIGSDFVSVRYDPIFINDKYSFAYHEMMFERLCQQLEGAINTIIISFLDMKKNTQQNQQQYGLYEMSEQQVHTISKMLATIAAKYHITLQTCAEHYNLSEYGIAKKSCISADIINKLRQEDIPYRKGNLRNHCDCIRSVDIGAYNSCAHYCRYCYANYEETKVMQNIRQHNMDSTLLIGELQADDVVKIRKK